MRGMILITCIFVAYILRDAWSLIPDKFDMVTPFKFSKQEISRAAWFHYAWIYAMFPLLIFLLQWYPDHWIWHVVFIMTIAELAEYFLSYNEPFGQLRIWNLKLNANVTNFRYIVLGICILIENDIIQWTHSD